MSVKVVYIIGPFRGPSNWAVQQNVRNAEAMSLAVATAGGMPLCPHKNTQHFDGLLTDTFWLEGTMELLRRSDAAMLCDGWARSSGSKGEIAEARRLSIPVFDSLADLHAWLQTGVVP